MTLIRELSPETDRDAVRSLYDRAADYMDMETGEAPSDAMVDEFFASAPPGMSASHGLKLGLFHGGRLDAIADVAFGFPDPQDCYIGLLLIASDQRGRGLGRQFVEHIDEVARARRAPRILLAVLDANDKGHAFWEREGFQDVQGFPPVTMGKRSHSRTRMERKV
jgi:GNAT superfamily N-acetyltransferase